MKRSIITFFGAVLMFLIISTCDDSHRNDDFSFSLTVVDGYGNPVPDLFVAVKAELDDIDFNKRTLIKDDHNILATSSFRFDVKNATRINYKIYNLKGELVDTICVNRRMLPGYYQYHWNTRMLNGENAPSSIYKAVFTARDTLNDTLMHQDSIYACFLEFSALGKTNDVGKFNINDIVYFPSVCYFNQIPIVDDMANLLGYAEYTGKIKIRLSTGMSFDPDSTKNFIKTIVNGNNEITLVLNDDQKEKRSYNAFNYQKDKPLKPIDFFYCIDFTDSLNDSIIGPAFWKIHQNYPNPFN